jgi:hypothetical protein
MSGGEKLLIPSIYQPLLGLASNQVNTNTWLTYTISWQPDQITWAVDGVPVLTKVYDQKVEWTDMKGVHFRQASRGTVKLSLPVGGPGKWPIACNAYTVGQ